MSVVLQSPPCTPIEPNTEVFHGVAVTDPYRWLEDQDSDRTRHWIEEQSNYARAVLDAIPIRGEVRRRVAELLAVEMIGPPYQIGDRYFFVKRVEQQNQPVICMRQGRHGEDHILVDPNVYWADGRMSVHIVSVSSDGKLLAYGVRHGAEDYQIVKILDVTTRKTLPDDLPRGSLGSFIFAADSRSYYYVHEVTGTPNSHRCAAYKHVLGTDPKEDRELFCVGEYPYMKLGMRFSDDRRYVGYIVLRSDTTNRIDLYVQDLFENSLPRLIAEGMEEPFYPWFAKNQLLVVTKFEATNRKIIAIDLASPQRTNWRDVIPESTAPITQFAVRNGFIFVSYVEDISTRTDIFDLTGRKHGSIPYPGKGSASLITNTINNDELFYTFSSFIHPDTVFSYRTNTGEQAIWSERKVASDPSFVEINQVQYQSKDGTFVPMSLIGRRGLSKNKSTPTILTGYGGFGKCLTPQFSAFATFLVEKGCLFAVANVRGGSELGARWHQEGKRQKRQNAFDDFIAAAEWLIDTGFTVPEKLAAVGGSNGGLLVGAAVTQRPELFRAVVCMGPLLDMLSYHRFPITKSWIDEYGSPDDPEDFRCLYGYSPYHNVREGIEWPAVLLVSGDADTRCDPMHARKMTAKLQATTNSNKPILLEYRALRGHMPVLPLSDRIEGLTDRLAFICDQLGV